MRGSGNNAQIWRFFEERDPQAQQQNGGQFPIKHGGTSKPGKFQFTIVSIGVERRKVN